MQRHQLYLIIFIFFALLLEHVAQNKLTHRILDGAFVAQLIGLIDHFLDLINQEVDVFHAPLSLVRCSGILVQVAFIIDVIDHFFDRRHRVIGIGIASNPLQPVSKATQAIKSFWHQCLLKPHLSRGRDHTDIAHGSVFAEFLNRTWPDFASWCIHNAQKRGIVCWVNQQAQIRHDVFNFIASEEGLTTAQLIRHLIRLELHLYHA